MPQLYALPRRSTISFTNEDLQAAVGKVPDSEHLFLLWDFNARVGGDHDSWPD